MSGPGEVAANVVLQAMQQTATNISKSSAAKQEAMQEDIFTTQTETGNPFVRPVRDRSKDLKTRRQNLTAKEKAKEKGEGAKVLNEMKAKAKEYQGRNPEFKEKTLMMLRNFVKPGDKEGDVLRKVQDFYQDVSLADEALEFLLETTGGELKEEVQKAKDDLNERFDREIAAGKNVSAEARAFAEKGLGTPTALRDMYRDITGNPPPPRQLFDQLSNKFPYKKLRSVIGFLLHAAGADLRAKGASIPRGMLHNIMDEVRTLQMILSVYRYFSSRMGLVEKMFAKEGAAPPRDLNFELLAKQFMKLIDERYPNAARVLNKARYLGVKDDLIGKIILFSQFRDAAMETPIGRIFRSVKHRWEIYQAILEALEELEDELEELREEEREGQQGEAEEDEEQAAK